MELNSLSFILLFLPLYVTASYLSKNNNYVLLLFSITFYLLTDIRYLLLLLIVILLSYYSAKYVYNNKKIYALYLISSIGILFIFKYGNLIQNLFFDDNIINFILPIGISYYLFEAISYVSDVYRGKYNYEKSLIKIAAYISFFPTIMSGPIIRYDSFKKWDRNSISLDSVADGLRIFIVGFASKVIIANQLAQVVSKYLNEDNYSSTLLFMGILAFILRLYYDFKGCSDMAIGTARMVGYEIPDNFNDPYISLSVSEFYRRWHISLGTWFKDYIYIPLGGNRVSKIKEIRNILIVWLFTGLWHGSNVNYAAWGLFLGFYIIFEKNILNKIRINKIIKWFVTMAVIFYSWLIFNANSFVGILRMTKHLLIGEHFDIALLKNPVFANTWLFFVLGVVFMIPRFKEIFKNIKQNYIYIYDLIIVGLLLISTIMLISSTKVVSVYYGF